MLWLTVALVLPQASVARQLRVVTRPPLVLEVESLPTWLTVAPLHVSLAVGAVKLGIVVPHSKVSAAPANPIVAPCSPIRGLLWLTVALVLPQAPVARQLRVVTNAPLVPELE